MKVMIKNNIIRKFISPTFGECLILKKDADNNALIYAPLSNQYIIGSVLDTGKGTWQSGDYFLDDLELAIITFNKNYLNKKSNENER